MRAKVIGFRRVTPKIDGLWALIFRANTIAPMINIGETAARPTQIGCIDFAKRLHHIRANPPDIGNWGIFTDPDSIVDATAEMFGKMAIDVAVDFAKFGGGVDGNGVHDDLTF